MSNVYNPAPAVTIDGIKDVFTAVIAPSNEPGSFANPLHITFASTGPVNTPVWGNGLKLQNVFGSELVDATSPFCTHQTPFLMYTNSTATPMCTIRVVPSDIGPKPRISLWAEIIESTKVTTYERDPDTGKHKLDTNGDKIKTGVTSGVKVRFFTKPVTSEVGQAVSAIGTFTEDGETSVCYPLYEFEHSFQGAAGNDVGIRMYPALESDSPNVEASEVDKSGFPVRIQLVRRTSTSTSGNVINTQRGLKYVEGSVKPGALQPELKSVYDVFTLLNASYKDLSATDTVYPDIGTIYKYDTYVKKVHELLNKYVKAADDYAVNPWTGVDFTGVPYEGYEALPSLDNGFIFSPSVTMFLEGGSDGTMTFETYDAAVKNYFDSISGWDEDVITDLGISPIKSMVETGFTMATKKSIIRFALGIHKAITLFACTQDMSRSPNSQEYDLSALTALNTYALSFPESTVHGTKAARMMIMDRVNYYDSLTYNAGIPGIYVGWTRFIDQFGSPTGKVNADKLMSSDNQKRITDVTTTSYRYQGAKARQAVWDNGGVPLYGFDTRTYFVPAFKSIYAEPTSVLTDIENVVFAVDLIHQSYRTWQLCTGFKGTNAERVAKANRILSELTKEDRYAGIVSIQVNNYMDAIDVNNKFSWHVNAIMSGGVGARNANIYITSKVRDEE